MTGHDAFESNLRSSRNKNNVHRLVILVGPHKSASSSVQEFFFRYASNKHLQLRLPSLYNWTWPWNPKRKSYTGRKAFAVLVKERRSKRNQGDGQSLVQLVYQSIRNALDFQQAQQRSHGTYPTATRFQLVLGTEEFDRFGSTPWSHWDGINAIRELIDFVALEIHNRSTATNAELSFSGLDWSQHDMPLHVEFVVNFRKPRSDQWISIWKQLTRKLREKNSIGYEYHSFLCDPLERIRLWEYLDAVANPLGLAQELVQSFINTTGTICAGPQQIQIEKVHLMDMQGIAQKGLDISHTVACGILRARPCMKGQLQLDTSSGFNSTNIVTNQRNGDPGLSTQQLRVMEFLFQARDCSYRSFLQHFESVEKIEFHHGDKLWSDCSAIQENGRGSRYWDITSTDIMLDLLQDQVGCGMQQWTIEDFLVNYRRPDWSFVDRKELDITKNEILEQTLRIQLSFLLMLIIVFLGWILPRTRGWKSLSFVIRDQSNRY